MKSSIKSDRSCIAITYYLMFVSSAVSGYYLKKCSCYMFNVSSAGWDTSREQCQTNGGDLVSIENDAEWEFIKKALPYNNREWWIGLTRSEPTTIPPIARWKWLTNVTCDLRQCQYISLDHSHGVIDIEDHEMSIWSENMNEEMGRICERKATDCKATEVNWCDNISSTRGPTLRNSSNTSHGDTTIHTTTQAKTTRSSRVKAIQGISPLYTTTQAKTTRSSRVKAIQDISPLYTATQAKTTRSSRVKGNEKKTESSNKKKESSMVVIMIIISVAILAFIGIVVVVICGCNRNEKDEEDQEQHQEINTEEIAMKERKTLVKLQPRRGLDVEEHQDPIFAAIDKTKKTKSVETRPDTAVKKSPKPPKKREEDLTYAVLGDFKENDSSPEVLKPPTYEETDYAIVNV